MRKRGRWKGEQDFPGFNDFNSFRKGLIEPPHQFRRSDPPLQFDINNLSQALHSHRKGLFENYSRHRVKSLGVMEGKTGPICRPVEEAGQFEVADKPDLPFFDKGQPKFHPETLLSNLTHFHFFRRLNLYGVPFSHDNIFSVTEAAEMTIPRRAGRANLLFQAFLILLP